MCALFLILQDLLGKYNSITYLCCPENRIFQ